MEQKLVKGVRNSSGVKWQTDCYRTINGDRYIAWMSFPSGGIIHAYRNKNLRCRRFGDELYMHVQDQDCAAQIDKEVEGTKVKTKKRVFDVREGDIWEFIGNYGTMPRHVMKVGNKYISYRGPNIIGEHAVLKSTFKRWWNGAGLVFATDWTGRDNDGSTA